MDSKLEMNLQAIWSERIAAYQASGQTMKAWCAEQNLTVHQLKYWLYKAQRQTRAVSTPTFRPVAVASPPRMTEYLHVQVGVARIEIQPGFEPKLLRDVVAALTSLC
ncbi:IS66 family insertion sequence element accessory protein TnpA [Paenibacillus sp. y28]|uniref:IS66 family insertion sequence element accessory protein TnpA n=1 Tax=Paenibacillus sp. y28 TaxID=3129110 RepID=UPI003FA72197